MSRTLAQSVSPALTGLPVMQGAAAVAPFFSAEGSKIVYDLWLYATIRTSDLVSGSADLRPASFVAGAGPTSTRPQAIARPSRPPLPVMASHHSMDRRT